MKKSGPRTAFVVLKSTEIVVSIHESLTDYEPCHAIRFVVPSRCAEIVTNSRASAASV